MKYLNLNSFVLKCFLPFFGLFFIYEVNGQNQVVVECKGVNKFLTLDWSGVDSVKVFLSVAIKEKDTYKIAWSLATLSEIFQLLKEKNRANEYQAEAIAKLKELNSDSLCLCVFDIEKLTYGIYRAIPNGTDLSVTKKYRDLALQTLPLTSFANIEEIIIHFLSNNAADAWKYDQQVALKYFERIRVIANIIIVRDMFHPNSRNLELIVDPIRRYVRFMYNIHFSKKPTSNILCVQNNCLEKAWLATQFLKSRNFKSELFKKNLSELNEKDFLLVTKTINYLDSIYYDRKYFTYIIQNDFKMDFDQQHEIDSLMTIISNLIPLYDLLVSDKITLNKIKQSLKENETYVSIMYTDNDRAVYAWKIEKNSEPKVIILDIKSIDLFFRSEYFRNQKISHGSAINISFGTKVSKFDLKIYYEKLHNVKLEPLSNEKYLYNKLIAPLKLRPNTKIVFEVDQNLGAFPLGLIKIPSTNLLFGQNHMITYTPSASVFYYLRTKLSKSYYLKDYVGFSFNESKRTFVDTTISKSATFFKSKSEIFNHCSESKIYASKDLIKNCKYLHFACHSSINGKDLRLVFGKDSLNDGFLSNKEIIEKLRNNSVLTAFTSCSTAPYLDEYQFVSMEITGSIPMFSESCVCSIGETFSNISSSFIAAGSNKLLVTQWDIPDSRISALFMADFFQNISLGKSPETALKGTQKKFSVYDIQYWGGYILVGD